MFAVERLQRHLWNALIHGGPAVTAVVDDHENGVYVKDNGGDTTS